MDDNVVCELCVDALTLTIDSIKLCLRFCAPSNEIVSKLSRKVFPRAKRIGASGSFYQESTTLAVAHNSLAVDRFGFWFICLCRRSPESQTNEQPRIGISRDTGDGRDTCASVLSQRQPISGTESQQWGDVRAHRRRHRRAIVALEIRDQKSRPLRCRRRALNLACERVLWFHWTRTFSCAIVLWVNAGRSHARLCDLCALQFGALKSTCNSNQDKPEYCSDLSIWEWFCGSEFGVPSIMVSHNSFLCIKYAFCCQIVLLSIKHLYDFLNVDVFSDTYTYDISDILLISTVRLILHCILLIIIMMSPVCIGARGDVNWSGLLHRQVVIVVQGSKFDRIAAGRPRLIEVVHFCEYNYESESGKHIQA